MPKKVQILRVIGGRTLCGECSQLSNSTSIKAAMMVQKQVWHSSTRYIIIVEGVATVQLELYDEPQGSDNITAFICCLWVNEDERKYGHGKRIMDRAESRMGVRFVETPDSITAIWPRSDRLPDGWSESVKFIPEE